MVNPFLQQSQEADLYDVTFGKFKLLSLLIGAAFKAGANIKSTTTEKVEAIGHIQILKGGNAFLSVHLIDEAARSFDLDPFN